MSSSGTLSTSPPQRPNAVNGWGKGCPSDLTMLEGMLEALMLQHPRARLALDHAGGRLVQCWPTGACRTLDGALWTLPSCTPRCKASKPIRVDLTRSTFCNCVRLAGGVTVRVVGAKQPGMGAGMDLLCPTQSGGGQLADRTFLTSVPEHVREYPEDDGATGSDDQPSLPPVAASNPSGASMHLDLRLLTSPHAARASSSSSCGEGGGLDGYDGSSAAPASARSSCKLPLSPVPEASYSPRMTIAGRSSQGTPRCAGCM